MQQQQKQQLMDTSDKSATTQEIFEQRVVVG